MNQGISFQKDQGKEQFTFVCFILVIMDPMGYTKLVSPASPIPFRSTDQYTCIGTRTDTESDQRCRTEWGWLARLIQNSPVCMLKHWPVQI